MKKYSSLLIDTHAVMSSSSCSAFSSVALGIVSGPRSCCPPFVVLRRGREGFSPVGRFLMEGEMRMGGGEVTREGED